MRTTRALLVPAVLATLFWVVSVTAQTTGDPACVAVLPKGGALTESLSLKARCNRSAGESTHCKPKPFSMRNVYIDYKEVCQWACANRNKDCCAPMGSCYVCCTAKGKCDNGKKGTVVHCMRNAILQDS